MRRVLHLLSQRPSRTGSGVTLDALVRHAGADGSAQRAIVGTPIDDPRPAVGDLPSTDVETIRFGTGGDLEFPLPGMSDVMPYPSARFSTLTDDALERYRAVWRDRIARAVSAFRPDVIHAHHVWLMSSVVKDAAPATPLVVHCHATGLRQRELCPRLAGPVATGVARAERFVVLHRGHARALSDALGIGRERIDVVGAGYRDDLFHTRGRAAARPPRIVYVGKYSGSKGVPSLLDAFERLTASHPEPELHIVGSGTGDEAERIAARIRTLAPRVVAHGALPQPELARLLRTCTLCVLPSFYEGVPLVLVEARACGCRVVATALPGVVDALAPALEAALDLVEPPRLAGVDVPDPVALPAFVTRLADALAAALAAPPPPADPALSLASFTWSAVYRRVAAAWRAAEMRAAPCSEQTGGRPSLRRGRRHRGPHPQDRELFSAETAAELQGAIGDLSWLLTRGYSGASAVELVGNRYGLRARQRVAVARCAAADQAVAERRRRLVEPARLAGRPLLIDGLNVLTTVEVALAGGVLLAGRDGCLRDMASFHGNYRLVAETDVAVDALLRTLDELEPATATVLIDRPVSNSGRLAATIRAAAESRSTIVEVLTADRVDETLRASDAVVATADSAVLDACGPWFNLARLVVERHGPARGDRWLLASG